MGRIGTLAGGLRCVSTGRRGRKQCPLFCCGVSPHYSLLSVVADACASLAGKRPNSFLGSGFLCSGEAPAAAPQHAIDPASWDYSLLPARAQQEEQHGLALVFGDGYAANHV